MKIFKCSAFFAVAFSFCSFLTLEGNAQVFCTECTIAPPGFVCTGAASGGDSCKTEAGRNCMVTGACVAEHNRGANGSPKTSCGLKILGHAQVKISDNLIRSVGAQDARMAIALLNVRNINVGFTVAKTYFSTVEYTVDDVKNHLTQAYDSAYFTAFDKRVADKLASGMPPVIYEVSLASDAVPGATTLKISTSDPAALRPSISVKLSKINVANGKNVSEGFQAETWEFK